MIAKGDLFVAYPDNRPAERLFVEVTRVGRDGTWADIRVCNWACMWTKRQLLKDGVPPSSVRRDWGMVDLNEQQADHTVKLDAERALEERPNDE